MSFRSTFPAKLAGRLAQRETSSRRYFRPIYSLHRWWARRPGSVFRAILLTAFSKPGETAESVAHRYFQARGGDGLQGKLVVDPFMGGGTTVFEALRLGASVVAADVNPVAWWVVRQSIAPVDLARLDEAYNDLADRLSQRLLSHYETHCPQCNSRSDGLYFFWVKELICPECGVTFDLHPDFKLARLRSGDYSVYCPKCGHVETAASIGSEHACTRCGHQYVPRKGHVWRGRYTCPSCGARGQVVDVLEGQSQPLSQRLFAVEYHCPHHGRGYKQADSFDLALYDRTRASLERLQPELKLPSQAIRPGLNTDQMRKHNYHYWQQLFNDRQLLGLGLLLQAIRDIEDRRSRELLLTVFSEVLDYNNMLCDYNYSYRKIGNLFGLHAFNVSMRPIENNLWGASVGSGTFSRYFRKLRAAKAYALRPYERDFDGHTMEFPLEKVSVEPITSAPPGGVAVQETPGASEDPLAAVLCRDSRQLPLADGTADAVVTDPPYFDNVMYGELAEFYYVWLRLALADDYPAFAPEVLDETDEVLTDPTRGKTRDDYLEGLGHVFAEAHRVLKPGGPLVFTFHHRSIEAWLVLLKALTRAGFTIDDTVPVHSEMSSSIHIRGKQAPKTDVIVVCHRVGDRQQADSVIPESQLAVNENSAASWEQRVRWLAGQLTLEEHAPEDARMVLFGEILRELSMQSARVGLNDDEARSALQAANTFMLS